MKQVIFAIALLAMASLTGCLTDDESSVDETTDTTSDNTGNTNDNSNDNSDTNQDNTDSGDDGMIDPVGTDGGVTIPEDSSIFIDNPNGYRTGKWNCEYNDSPNWQKTECEYTYFNTGFGINDYGNPFYSDGDLTYDIVGFSGWVNKTGETVSIEGLYFPDRSSFNQNGTSNADADGDGTYDPNTPWTSNEYLGKPVSESCQKDYYCQIIFYGNGGLTFNTQFTMSSYEYTYDYVDTDNDNIPDSIHRNYHYQHHSIELDLPFEPYGFSIYQQAGDRDSLDRIF